MATADEIAGWDAEAETFDEPADHGLAEPVVRRAWRELLLGDLPQAPARVADLGCGTGTPSVLLAESGYQVDGLDFSPRMVELARDKASGVDGVGFTRGDAFKSPLPHTAYDVVLCRHVLWAMPEPATALSRWTWLLRPAGRLVLVEGRWSNRVDLSAEETVQLVQDAGRSASLTRLTDPGYWGRPITDDRYLVTSLSDSTRERGRSRRGRASHVEDGEQRDTPVGIDHDVLGLPESELGQDTA